MMPSNARRTTGGPGSTPDSKYSFVLTYANGASGRPPNAVNHAKWRTFLADDAMVQFALTAGLLRLPPGQPLARPTGPVIGEGGVTPENFGRREDAWFKKTEKWDNELTQLFGFIFNSLDESAKDAVKSHPLWSAPGPLNLETPSANNVHQLLRVIQLTFLSPEGAPAPQIRLESLDALLQSKKESDESLDGYIRAVQARRQIVNDRTGYDMPEDDFALLILRGLDAAYDAHKSEILRSASMVGGTLPPTVMHLKEALARLEGTLPPAESAFASQQQRGGGASGGGASGAAPPSNPDARREWHRERRESAKQGKSKGGAPNAAPRPAPAKHVSFEATTSAKPKSDIDKPASSFQQRRLPKGGAGKNRPPQSANAAARVDHSSSDDSDTGERYATSVHEWPFAYFMIALATWIATTALTVTLANFTSTINVGVGAIITIAIHLAGSMIPVCNSSPESWNFAMDSFAKSSVILLDNAATHHLFGDADLLSDMKRTMPALIKGASGTRASLSRGFCDLLGVWSQYLAGAPNLFSFVKALETYDITLQKDGKYFACKAKDRSHTLIFVKYRNVYPLVIRADKGSVHWKNDDIFSSLSVSLQVDIADECSRDDASAGDKISAFTTTRVANARVRAQGMAPLKTVSKLAKSAIEKIVPSFTKAEVVRALEARHLERALGTSAEGLKQLLANGHVVDCELVSKDVDRAGTIWGKNVSNLLTNPFKADTVPKIADQGRTIDIDASNATNVAFADLIFIWGLVFLVTTFRPCRMTTAVPVKSKGEEHLTKALLNNVNGARAAGFKIDEVRVDGEAALASNGCASASAKEHLRIRACTRGAHQAEAERENGLLRRRLIQIVLLLAFRLPQDWVKYAVQHALDMKAFSEHSDSTHSGPTAGEMYYGRKIHERELRITFGDYVISRVPLDARKAKDAPFRDECIFLGRRFESDDSADVYSFRFKKVVNRKYSELTLLPMPEHAVQTINELAHAQMQQAKTVFEADFTGIVPDDHMSPEDKERLRLTSSLVELYASSEDKVRELSSTRMSAARAPSTPLFEGASPEAHDDDDNDMPELLHFPVDGRGDDGQSFVSDVEPGLDATKQDVVADNDGGNFVFDIETAKGFAGAVDVQTAGRHRASTSIFAGATKTSIMPDRVFGKFEWGNPSAEDYKRDDLERMGDERVLASKRFRSLKSYIISDGGVRAKPRTVAEESAADESPDEPIERVALSMSIREAMRAYPAETHEANVKEMKQILHRALKPVDYRELTSEQKRKGIPCLWFAKAKYHPHTSKFMKMKTRCCAAQNKKRQKESYFVEPTSPTISRVGFFTMLAVSTSRNWKLAAADIPGAYLHAERDKRSERLFGWLDKEMTKVALEVDPSLQPLVSPRGELWGEFGNMYGLVESGGAWHRKVLGNLVRLGFEPTPEEPCLFHGTFKGVQHLVTLYVDDVLASGPNTAILAELFGELDIEYPGTLATMTKGDIVPYLSCSIDCSEDGVTYVHQPDFVRKLVADYFEGKVPRRRASPAPADLVTVDEASPPLVGEDADKFRAYLMRAAWLIQMTRYDCLVPLAFLSQRMHCSTEQDKEKLDHLIGYIASTADHGITLEPGSDDLNLYLYTDASHGIFPKGRSVSGAVLYLGGAPIWAASRKSSVVAKSSYEAETLSCSDFSSQAIHARNTLKSLGVEQKAATVYTDSASAIAGYKNKRPRQLTTRHISIREYWVSERCDAGELDLIFCPTDLQVADICTKPMVGAKFREMRSWLLGWEKHPGPAMQALGGGASRKAYDADDVTSDEEE